MGKRFLRYLIVLIMVLILNVVTFANPQPGGGTGGERPNPPGMGNRSLIIEIDSTFELE